MSRRVAEFWYRANPDGSIDSVGLCAYGQTVSRTFNLPVDDLPSGVAEQLAALSAQRTMVNSVRVRVA